MRVRNLTKIATGDINTDRAIAQIVDALNPVLRDIALTPLVAGSTGGNAALKSLIQALARIGLITDGTT